MGINKVIYDGYTLVDLTGDNIQPGNVDEGITFHDASGEQQIGTKAALPNASGVSF